MSDRDKNAEKVLEILQRAVKRGDNSSSNDDNRESIKDMSVEELNALYNHPNTFKVGQRVRWKKGMMHKTMPTHEHDCIIVEILPPDRIVADVTDESASTPYWQERFDVRIGFVQKNTFCILFCDSRRFEPVPEALIKIKEVDKSKH